MGISAEYKTFIEDLFEGFGPVTIRRMFGGAGIFRDGLMFALVADDTLYLKVDDGNRNDFEDAGMRPFTYHAKGKPMSLSYWEVPESLYEDPAEFAGWAEKAYAVALRNRKK